VPLAVVGGPGFASIALMSTPTIRVRGRTLPFLRRRLLRRLGVPDVSQLRLRAFLAEAGVARPPFPPGPPRSIAVVIPAFRHARYLPEALASVDRQTRAPDEIVVIDDASPDATAEIAAARAADRGGAAPLRVLRNERNLGQAASLNRAVGAVETDLVMILNDDDYLVPDAIQTMIGLFTRHPEVGLVGGMNVPFAGSAELAAALTKLPALAGPDVALRVSTPAEAARFRFADQLNMTHSGMTFRRAAWEAAGGYRADRRNRVVPYSDRDLQIRINALWPVGVAESAVFSLWRRDSSVDQGRDS
jgi:glycosyltransferase involved in cell wall biosynthesis